MISFRQADLMDTIQEAKKQESIREFQIPIQIRKTHNDPNNTSRQLLASWPMAWEDQTVTMPHKNGLSRLKNALPKLYESLGYTPSDNYETTRYFSPVTGNPGHTLSKLINALKQLPFVANAIVANGNSEHVNIKVFIYTL